MKNICPNMTRITTNKNDSGGVLLLSVSDWGELFLNYNTKSIDVLNLKHKIMDNN